MGITIRLIVALGTLLAVVAGACGGSSGSKTGSGVGSVNAVDTGAFGSILAGANGRAIYILSSDQPNKSSCTGTCAEDWPPLTVAGKPKAGAGVNGKSLSTLTRADGTKQVTFAGQPLYYFASDKQPGDINGQGLTAYGGNWYVLSPSGEAIKAPRPDWIPPGIWEMGP